MVLKRVSLTEIGNSVAENVEQDQTARMCSLILLYNLRTTRIEACPKYKPLKIINTTLTLF